MHNYHLYAGRARVIYHFSAKQDPGTRYGELAQIECSESRLVDRPRGGGARAVGVRPAACRRTDSDFPAAGYFLDTVGFSETGRQRDLAGGALSATSGLRSHPGAASVFDVDRSEAGGELVHPRGALQVDGSGFGFWAPSLHGHWRWPKTRRRLIASRYSLSRSMHGPVGDSRRALFGSAAPYARRA